MPASCKPSGIYLTPCLLAIHVVPQTIQTMINAKIALALVPFLRMVKGFNADKLFKASVDCDKVLLKSKRGMNDYELSFCTTIKL